MAFDPGPIRYELPISFLAVISHPCSPPGLRLSRITSRVRRHPKVPSCPLISLFSIPFSCIPFGFSCAEVPLLNAQGGTK